MDIKERAKQHNSLADTLTLKPICTGLREPLVSWGGFGMARRKHQRHSRLQIPSKGVISRTGNGKVILEGIWKGRGLSKDAPGPQHELLPCVHSADVIWWTAWHPVSSKSCPSPPPRNCREQGEMRKDNSIRVFCHLHGQLNIFKGAPETRKPAF